jgi:hypothetical protein
MPSSVILNKEDTRGNKLLFYEKINNDSYKIVKFIKEKKIATVVFDSLVIINSGIM